MSNRDTDDDYDRTRTDETARTDDRAPDRTMDDEYDPNPSEAGKWISALIALLGLWMIAEALLFDLVASQFWNDIVVGALLLAVGAYNYYRRSDERFGSVAAATLAALLGLWLVASPFMFGADTGSTEAANDFGFWNDIIVGLAALILGAYSAYKGRDRRETARRTTRT